MRRLVLLWLGLNAAAVIVPWLLGGGRPEANAHPTIRHGGLDWY